jgi:hypothetical protein
VATNVALLYMASSIKIAQMDHTNTDNALISQNIDFPLRTFSKTVKTAKNTFAVHMVRNSNDNTFIKYSLHQLSVQSRPSTHLSVSSLNPPHIYQCPVSTHHTFISVQSRPTTHLSVSSPPDHPVKTNCASKYSFHTTQHQVDRSPHNYYCITLQTYTAKTLYKTLKYNKTTISKDTIDCDTQCIANYHHSVNWHTQCIANNHHSVHCDTQCIATNHHSVHCDTQCIANNHHSVNCDTQCKANYHHSVHCDTQYIANNHHSVHCDTQCKANYHHSVQCDTQCIANNHHWVHCDTQCIANYHHSVHCDTHTV